MRALFGEAVGLVPHQEEPGRSIDELKRLDRLDTSELKKGQVLVVTP